MTDSRYGAQSDDDGRQGMADRYQGRHGGVDYFEVEPDEEEQKPQCICPKCGYSGPYEDETPCVQQGCPQCGSALCEFTGK